MKLISVNVGLAREIEYAGKKEMTGIYKNPVPGPVMLRQLSLDGDQQVDLKNHGGVGRAVYMYPYEHYEYWSAELNRDDLTYGIFGENLTTLGLLETEVRIGDRYRVGEAEIVITQPRMPCYKLGVRMGDERIIKRMTASRKHGFYGGVVSMGQVRPGDPISLVWQDPLGLTVDDVVRIHTVDTGDVETLRKAVSSKALAEEYRQRYRKQLAKLET